jgi:LysR family transcriptional regulator, benzoate and cis,cis-muconate-responsive activator of ben and cat genes
MNPSAPRSAGFELRHLRSFVAVAEELHFGRAAIRLGIAQPPLSQQIQQLERHLDTALFERTSRQVRLTDAGVVFLAEARRILLAVEQAAASARRAARGETGELKVAFAATVMFLALPHILRTFRARFPDVRLDLREMATGSQLAAIKNGDLDIGFVREPLPDPDLDTQVVFREPLRITVDSAHPLAQKKHVRVADLANEPFVLFPSEIAPGLHSQVMKLCRDAGFSPRVVEISRELYTTVSLVEAGVGVSILPASVERLGWSGVRYLPLPAKTPMTRVAASWRRDRVRPVLSALLTIARETSRETASDAQEEIVASSPTNVRANKERRR